MARHRKPTEQTTAAGLSRGSVRGPKPVKTCVGCGRPFEWRRKWARCWEAVKYCSDRCRRGGPPAGGTPKD